MVGKICIFSSRLNKSLTRYKIIDQHLFSLSPLPSMEVLLRASSHSFVCTLCLVSGPFGDHFLMLNALPIWFYFYLSEDTIVLRTHICFTLNCLAKYHFRYYFFSSSSIIYFVNFSQLNVGDSHSLFCLFQLS